MRILRGAVPALSLIVLLAAATTAVARPPYTARFKTKYPQLASTGGASCSVCHIGKPAAKKYNDYGTALGKRLEAKDPKAPTPEEIDAALTTTEKDSSSTPGKTFGDLIRDGKLPGKNPS